MQQNGNKLTKCSNFGYVVGAKEMQPATKQ